MQPYHLGTNWPYAQYCSQTGSVNGRRKASQLCSLCLARLLWPDSTWKTVNYTSVVYWALMRMHGIIRTLVSSTRMFLHENSLMFNFIFSSSHVVSIKTARWQLHIVWLLYRTRLNTKGGLMGEKKNIRSSKACKTHKCAPPCEHKLSPSMTKIIGPLGK